MARNLAVNSFAGSTPRRADHLTPLGSAARAVDCKLWHGTLESWREPRFIQDTASDTLSVYQAHTCCWIESTKCASWAEGSVEQRHIFATKYNDYAYPVRIVFDDNCDPTVYRLGLPCPPERPTATAAETFSRASSPRQYVYQYIDSFGNRSAASEPSEELVVAEGGAVQVSGWTIPAGNWDIQKIRIYRSVAGFESSLKEGENTIEAAWMLVDEIPATQVSYVDTKYDIDLQEALVEDYVEPPPADLEGITWIQSMNCLAGYSGRTLHFSHNNKYHDWPYSLMLDDTIKGIVESNEMIYVATDGPPYVVYGEASCKDAGCRKAVRMPEALPLIAPAARSFVAVPSGAVYPTHSGLVYMAGNRTPILISTTHYAPDDWQALHPDTAKIAYHEGRIFAFFRNGGFCMSIKDGAGHGSELDHHTELSMRPDELFVSRTGKFYMRMNSALYEWDRGATLMPHTYEYAETLIGVPFNFGALQVFMHPGNERVQVFCDNFPALDETVFTNDHFAMPLWATGQEFRWILTGTAKVKAITLAPSTKEL